MQIVLNNIEMLLPVVGRGIIELHKVAHWVIIIVEVIKLNH